MDVATDVGFYADNGVTMDCFNRNFYACLLACVVFSLFSWFLYCQVSPTHPHCDIDSKAYLERGFLCAQTGRFVTATSPEQPYYALGYAGIIGLLYHIFWPSPVLIILLQLLLACMSCFIMMRCARLLFGMRAAGWVAFFFAVSLGYLVFVQFVLTEIVLSFFLLLSFERLVTWITFHGASLCPLATAALALGLSIAIKPAALYSVFILAPLIGYVAGTWRQRLIRSVVFALCFYIPVVGYMTYNYHAFGNFCVSTLDRVNVYYWFFPNVLAHLHGTTSDAERLSLLARSQGTHNFAAVENLFWQSLRDNPWIFIYVWIKNVLKTFAGLYTTNLKVLIAPSVHGIGVSFFKTSGTLITRVWSYIAAGAPAPWVIIIGCCEAVLSLLRYFLCLIALVGLIRCKKIVPVALCCAYIVYFSLITGHDGCARFRMMFEFLLIILAAGGWSMMMNPAGDVCNER